MLMGRENIPNCLFHLSIVQVGKKNKGSPLLEVLMIFPMQLGTFQLMRKARWTISFPFLVIYREFPIVDSPCPNSALTNWATEQNVIVFHSKPTEYTHAPTPTYVIINIT